MSLVTNPSRYKAKASSAKAHINRLRPIKVDKPKAHGLIKPLVRPDKSNGVILRPNLEKTPHEDTRKFNDELEVLLIDGKNDKKQRANNKDNHMPIAAYRNIEIGLLEDEMHPNG